MGGEQSSLNLGQAVEACRCDCDTRKDEEGDPRRGKIPVGTATPRGFQEFQRASHTSKNTITPELEHETAVLTCLNLMNLSKG